MEKKKKEEQITEGRWTFEILNIPQRLLCWLHLLKRKLGGGWMEGRNKHFHNIVPDGGRSVQNQKPLRNNSPNGNLDHFRLLQGE